MIEPHSLHPNIVPLNAEEAGRICNVSKWTMYKRAQQKSVPHIRIGKIILFEMNELTK